MRNRMNLKIFHQFLSDIHRERSRFIFIPREKKIFLICLEPPEKQTSPLI